MMLNTQRIPIDPATYNAPLDHSVRFRQTASESSLASDRLAQISQANDLSNETIIDRLFA